MTICLNMIVKNEAHVIERALRSVLPFIQSYSIADTGSTDNTKAIIARVMEEAGIPGVLASDKWENFGHNRNLVLSRSTGDYTLTVDADEIFEGQLMINGEFDAYQIRLNEGPVEYWSTRVFRNDGAWGWEGEYHECPQHPSPVVARLMLAHISTPHDGARDLAGSKTEELLAYYEKAEPTQWNTFYHAQTLFGAGRHEEAIAKYTECAKIGGHPEWTYYSVYQAGVLLAKQGRTDSAITVLLKAYFFRRSRYEALVWACMLLRSIGKHRQAYLYSSHIPQPSQDLVFVERDVEWRLLEEHALAAAALGRLDEARQFFEYAAQYDLPEIHRARFERNMDKMTEAILQP